MTHILKNRGFPCCEFRFSLRTVTRPSPLAMSTVYCLLSTFIIPYVIWYMVYIVYLWLCRYVCLQIMLIIAYLSTLRRCPESFFFFFFFFHLTYSRWTSSLPSCLWSQRIFPSLPGSRLTIFLSRCKFSTLTTRQPMVEFYLLTFPRFPLRKKEHKSYFGKNRTHDFRTSRCAAYLQDHSGDERLLPLLK